MSYQATAGVMETPVAPAQVGGWSVPFVYHDVNLSWVVCTRRGGQVLRTPRLSQDQVRAFDANKEWARLR